ncbi:hypothetical protein [uncultured Methanomethylovorans sp.]|uniref:hypothetical protein n=1 Tax=uncultured Methanomethylovorans sp. TaxID=183759 RepID=UPI0037488A66
MPLICIIVPWEFYFYNSLYSTGWGIKFSLFYVNFDMVYGTLFVDVAKQLSLLSYGGLAPSFRTISWFLGALICVVVLINENFKENLSETFSVRTSGYLLILCSAFNILGSFVVWSSSFKAMPIGFIFLLFTAYFFLKSNLDINMCAKDC